MCGTVVLSMLRTVIDLCFTGSNALLDYIGDRIATRAGESGTGSPSVCTDGILNSFCAVYAVYFSSYSM